MGPEPFDQGKTVVARLFNGPAQELLPALLRAEVTTASQHGLVVRGLEALSRGQQKSRVHFVPQTWWAFVLTEDGVDRYDGDDPLESLAEARPSWLSQSPGPAPTTANSSG